MTYLLDTCVISDFVKGLPATLDKLLWANLEEIGYGG
jgi:predicted nucleic acid-binding protein